MTWEFKFNSKANHERIRSLKYYMHVGMIEQLSLFPDNETLRFFVSSISVLKFPGFLKTFANEDVSGGALFFYKNLDWELIKDLKEQAGEVSSGDIAIFDEFSDDIIIKENLVGNLLIDYSEILLKSVPIFYPDIACEWSERVNIELSKLRSKYMDLPS